MTGFRAPAIIHPNADSLRRARLEAKLAIAYRNVWQCAREAESFRGQSLCDDLYQLAEEIDRLVNDLLRGRPLR